MISAQVFTHSTPSLSLGVLVVSTIAWVIWNALLYPKIFSPLRRFPGPKDGDFLHGQLWRILSEPVGIPMREWINTIPNDGIIRFTTVFNQERLILTSPEALSDALVTHNYDWDKPEQMKKGLGRIVGQGVLLASGNVHKTQRKCLLPAFSFRHIKTLYPIFWEKSCEMVEAITKATANADNTNAETSISITDWLRRATLDIIGLAGFGQDFDALGKPHSELSNIYEKVFDQPQNENVMKAIETLENIFPVAWLGSLPLQHNRDVKKASMAIRQAARMVIRSQEQFKTETTSSILSGNSLLSIASRSGYFTEDNLIDQVMTFLAAGHETVSTATGWALVVLCRQPVIQERLRNEIRSQLPSPSQGTSKFSAQILDSLPYLHAVCNEVLRFYPPVPLTRRVCVRDTTIQGERVPKGTNILIVPAALNVSKKLWGEDALEFNPDRWMGSGKNNGGTSSNFANMTFLHGPRSCIGASFAKAEFACLLASIVGRLKFKFSDPDYKSEAPSAGVTARLKHELLLTVEVVEGW
ncbi:hypothetical protein KXX29_009738 [Aspergillus fumigatus]|nr:hypothetical protein KXX06_004673 [Aspergillus fumigatus]KAH1515615.1 hypothetical protein KXX29_009738 [Aspergillus fumigatus]KAH2377271.1 hypothetical protein KXV62_000572 [Aspergillus fumigatus]